jgi:soluble lytic murein transglycosylase
MLNLKKLLACSVLVVFISATTLSAAGFETNLSSIAAMRSKKQYSNLVARLQKLNAPAELEDLRLFLLAESLKNNKQNAEALKVYKQLLKKFPETETAFQARLPAFLLQLEGAGENNLAQLEGYARALPTAWQRGTALSKLAELKFIKEGKKSRFSLLAIREFHSDKPFYKTIAESHKLLIAILAKPQSYYFTDDEWLEIFLRAKEENLLGKNFPKHKNTLKLFGAWGWPAYQVFQAVSLAQNDKLLPAKATLGKVIANPKAKKSIRALAYQERAYINYNSKNYPQAIADYRKALELKGFPVDARACRYRIMRSAFMAGRDSECLEMLTRMMKSKNAPEPLLPIQIYEMALTRFDNNRVQASVPLFMFLSRHFPGHYRADDAIGYAILAMGKNSDEGQTLLKLLTKKYPNSFFIYWLAPELRQKPLPCSWNDIGKLDKRFKNRVKAWKKLWKTDFVSFAREESRKLTDKYPRNLPLFNEIVKICNEADDYNQLTAYGERLARQLLEVDKPLSAMPDWAWKAHYPMAYKNLVNKYAKIYNIDPYWILSIMREESHFRENTLSRSNAHSLMQILPSTGKWIAQKVGHRPYRQSHLWNPEVNIKFGSWYLKYLSDLFNGDLFLASASYNGGQGNIQRKVEKGPYAHLGVLERLDHVPMSETRDYYKKVMGSYWNYQRLYSK